MGLFDIFKKKSPKQHRNITVQPETYICARCKKEITDEESEWIGNHRFCTKCAKAPKANTVNSHSEENAYPNHGFAKDKDKKLVATNETVKPKDKPCEPIEVKYTVLKDIKPANGAGFSFEKTAIIIEIVQAEGKELVRITDYNCYAGSNGRPEYSLFEFYYEVGCVDLSDISATNYKHKINGEALYQSEKYDWGVILNQDSFLTNADESFDMRRKHALEKQLMQIDSITDNVIAKKHFFCSPAYKEKIKNKAETFLKKYISNPMQRYTFYWSEYPMGAVRSKEFCKIDSVWCVYQYDYDKDPPEKKIAHPEINDDNLLEGFVEVFLTENSCK